MLDFLFITSPTNARNPHPPYYFMSLAAYLRGKGCSVRIIDQKGGDRPADMKAHKQKIASALVDGSNRARFVGLAAFHSDYPMIYELGQMVKFHQPDTTLLVGNAHSTINPEDFIFPESPFDIAVIGEGEETCWELWKWYDEWDINDMDALDRVNGIGYLDEKREFIKTEPRHFMDLTNLPMSAYDLIEENMHSYYLKPQKLIIRRIYCSMICVFAGRGCPFDCDFCAANVVWQANKGKACRLRPVDNVIQEISHLIRHHHLDFFYLFDDMFGMSKKWMDEWFDKKANYYPQDEVPYACQTRADIVTEEMIRGLKETGCIQLDIGVESGSQRLLDTVNKGITIDQIRQVFGWCSKHKLRSFATMLLNLPSENRDDLKLTYDLLKELKPSAGVIFGVTTPYPGTKIYEDYCTPKLTVAEYSKLIGNRLNPIERFRMAEHDIDLERLWDKWNIRFRATPTFERMWAMKPFQKLYWKAILRSTRKKQYLKCWVKDIPKTFLLWVLHKTRLYRFVKRIQYRDKGY